MQVNDAQKDRLVQKMDHYFKGQLNGKTIALWGLAFKPNTDDIREAPAIHIIDALLEKGAYIRCFDPEAMDNVRQLYGARLEYARDQYDVLIGADALAIVTEWSMFRTPSFTAMQELMNAPVIFDGRNLYDLEILEELNFYYESIGRTIVRPRN
jgi:UDPglucose 6-dehydrogenase